MESKLQESPSDPRQVPVYVTLCADQGNEISLIDLWRVVAARKNLILMSLLVSIGLATAYAFLAESLYRAEAYLLPPQQQDIQSLMIGKEGLEITRNTPDLVYRAFLSNFKSKGVRREFFNAHDLADYYLADKPHTDADIDRVFDKVFSENLQLRADKQDASLVVVRFGDPDPGLAAQRLNQFIAFANERTVRQLLGNINAAIRAEVERVRRQLASKSKLATQRRYDAIIKLQEALRVAGSLGFEGVDSLAVIADTEKAAIEVNTAQIPLYMRGAKALEAEIAVLESRKSDEPFIVGLRDLQEKLAFLEGLSINRGMLSAVTIDTAARAPYQAEKPRKKMIIMLAAVFGLIIGIFLAFIAEFRSKARE